MLLGQLLVFVLQFVVQVLVALFYLFESPYLDFQLFHLVLPPFQFLNELVLLLQSHLVPGIEVVAFLDFHVFGLQLHFIVAQLLLEFFDLLPLGLVLVVCVA